MKKKLTAVICVLAVIEIGILVGFYACLNQKSNDNLPTLSLIAEMDEADVNELLAGYRRSQLRTIWEEPTFTDTNSDIWEIDGKITLDVSYNNQEKVVVCRLATQEVIPQDLPPYTPVGIFYTDVWPVNTFTDGLPVPPGTVNWTVFNEGNQSYAINLTDMGETDYADYMKLLQQEGFTVVEDTSENVKGQNYISVCILLSNGEKNLSISYIPGNFAIYISFVE